MTDSELTLTLQMLHMGVVFRRGNNDTFLKFHDGGLYIGRIKDGEWKPWYLFGVLDHMMVSAIRAGRYIPFHLDTVIDERYQPFADHFDEIPVTIKCAGDLQQELDKTREELEKHKRNLDDIKREYFHKGWRKAEEKYKQQAPQEDAGERLTDVEWLAKTLMVDSSECDPHVWYKARKQYMLAHHPDRNKWADPEVVAKVNAVFDKVFK